MNWYNKYRPQSFEEVVGQDLVKKILQNALAKGMIKHGYLLSGPRGVGKTTLARIFANQLNQTDQNPEAKIDIIEMDAASNTGIDDIRQLIDAAQTPPLVGQYKIYIIDEVHMLSKPAMNALLKILEEPPAQLVFLLATTNPEKLLPTVLSRLSKLNLTSHSETDLITRLYQISQSEKLRISPEALKLIARRAEGSQRDAINLLQTVASYGLEEFTENDVAQILGLVQQNLLQNLADSLLANQISPELLSNLEKQGVEAETLLAQFLEYLLDISFQKTNIYDLLIWKVAEVVNLRLSLSSPIQAIALIQTRLWTDAKYKPQKVNTSSFIPSVENAITQPTPPPISIPSDPAIPNIPIQSGPNRPPVPPTAPAIPGPEVQSLSDETDSGEIDKPEQTGIVDSVMPTEATDPTGGSQNPSAPLTTAQVQQKIQALISSANASPTIKMILPDMQVEQVEQHTVTLSLSSAIFATQMKQPQNLEWLKTQLGLSIPPQIIIRSLSASNPHPTSPTQNTPKLNSPTTKAFPAKTNQDIQNPTFQSQPKPSKPQDKIFYAVYNQLPEPMTEGSLPVIKYLPLPPTTTNGLENDDWEKHTSDFEFED
jgi:DNA polymerase III subunit gamma/tau